MRRQQSGGVKKEQPEAEEDNGQLPSRSSGFYSMKHSEATPGVASKLRPEDCEGSAKWHSLLSRRRSTPTYLRWPMAFEIDLVTEGANESPATSTPSTVLPPISPLPAMLLPVSVQRMRRLPIWLSLWPRYRRSGWPSIGTMRWCNPPPWRIMSAASFGSVTVCDVVEAG